MGDTRVPDLTAEDAQELARTALGLEPSILSEALRVDRLDAPGEAYYLVLFGRPEATTAVAAVDAASGQLLGSAQLSGRGPHLVVSRLEAAARASVSERFAARLVWQPSRQSRSPLYPLWEVRADAGSAYVDQAGRTWSRLERGGPGGNGGEDAGR